MSLYHVVYASEPTGFDDEIRKSILDDSRRCNARDGLTGALVCRDDLFMQWLEGPEAAVRLAFDRIQKDSRHRDIRAFLIGSIAERLFPTWAMRDDPARSWMWSQRDIADGALDTAEEIDLMAIFTRIAAEPN